MKLPVRILLGVLCAAMILLMGVFIPSPKMQSDFKWRLQEKMDEENNYVACLFSRAAAEDAEELVIEDVTEGSDDGASGSAAQSSGQYELPIDFSIPPKPNPACFTDSGYQDDSITVKIETVEEDNVIWRVARITVKSPTQLRTATAGKLTSSLTAKVKSMAEKNNAVIALSGDYFVDKPQKTSFEYRMGQKIRNKANKIKDILIIDENGDFHTFVKSNGLEAYKGQIINAFTFGPVLVKDGAHLEMDSEYGYNPDGREPRAAIGQTGPLQYVFVIAEGRGESVGATHQEIADFMYKLGCKEAYNLDGGGSASMAFNGEYVNNLAGGERSLSDIIYFATAVPEASWQ